MSPEEWRRSPHRGHLFAFGRDSFTLKQPESQTLTSPLFCCILRGVIHVVVVYRLEHLSANLTELAKIIELLYQHKVSLVSLSPRLNTSEPAGKLAVSLLLSFARFESRLNTDPQAMVAPVTPVRLSLSGSKPAEYEKFLQKSQQQSSEFRHTIRIEFLLLGPGRKKAFLTWAQKGFGLRKPAASQRQTADSSKTA